MSNNTKYESKAITTQIKATSRVSAKIGSRKFCVYAHKSPSNKFYFGITSLKLNDRWHSNGNGYKNQQLFYRAIQKYGWNNFEHIIIAKNLTQEQAHQMEKDLIFMFNSTNPVYGYNITQGGEGMLGYTHTKSAKRKISKSSKKRKSYLNFVSHPPKIKKRCGLVDTKGNIVYSFNSVTECAKALDISITTVSRNLKKNGNYGYLKFKEIN